MKKACQKIFYLLKNTQNPRPALTQCCGEFENVMPGSANQEWASKLETSIEYWGKEYKSMPRVYFAIIRQIISQSVLTMMQVYMHWKKKRIITKN